MLPFHSGLKQLTFIDNLDTLVITVHALFTSQVRTNGVCLLIHLRSFHIIATGSNCYIVKSFTLLHCYIGILVLASTQLQARSVTAQV